MATNNREQMERDLEVVRRAAEPHRDRSYRSQPNRYERIVKAEMDYQTAHGGPVEDAVMADTASQEFNAERIHYCLKCGRHRIVEPGVDCDVCEGARP